MDEKQISAINSVSLPCANLLVQQEKPAVFLQPLLASNPGLRDR